ncbi:MAG: NAD-dependent epimerase/dehydratase family protein [Rhizobiales bacterium]|nr:NAD-dependent epimerase/dehydratase family protein [Hyphomicrobiales bacterium]MBO6697770.1 NAD-dependent epimerase/dehydratase family protein [Hyphomicrobiales bacterium]MBO6735975.1 NAD-dependent epimerase/dehydratase family protein [Hyphomicrobiales bacterium]MBO6912445.1 NAD-dependent epimerase/dehydratase family protein [Hyphomicrobiales bacterium]MBO6955075.1 NAD-dependent epimerase/dehydratase family protein [Hyphomicrobiales bacterium]
MAETVFLTGASGFIAKHIIVQLLNAGYQVRGSVRSLSRGDEIVSAVTPHLDDANKLDERLSFVALDLSKDEGWNGVMDGCSALLHTASPFPLQQPDNEEEIIRPAVNGTERALKAAQASGIERVVVTSSAVAVMHSDLPKGRTVYDEADWSEDFYPTQNAYGRSKTHAEKAAWAFVANEASTIKLTTINPVLALGPALDGNYGTSLQVVERVFSGKDPMQPRFGLPIVDVRDVAAMHVKALSTPQSEGQRILASESFLWLKDVAEILRQAYPDRGIKAREAPDFLIKMMALFDSNIKSIIPQLGVPKNVSNQRARDVLGIDFIPARDAVLASAESIKRFAT